MGSPGFSHSHMATVIAYAIIVLIASGRAQARVLRSVEEAPASPTISLADVYRACESFTGVCNNSAACVAAISKYRNDVYGVADHCDCANAIGYDLVNAYSAISPAVTYISNCMPDCLFGEACPFVSMMIALLSNGGGRGAMAGPNNTAFTGVGLVKLNIETSQVLFNLTSAGLTDDVLKAGMEVTIKRGTPMDDGEVVLTLSTATPGVVAGSVKVPDFQAAKDISYSPEEYYLEVRPKQSRAGNLRGTLGATAALMAKVSSIGCAPPSSSDSGELTGLTGMVSIVADSFRVCYKLGGIANNTEKGASVNSGEMCSGDSSVVFPLFGGAGSAEPQMSGCGTPPRSSIFDLLASPSAAFASLNVTSNCSASPVVTLKGGFASKVELTTTLEKKNVGAVLAGAEEESEDEQEDRERGDTKIDLVIGEGYGCYSFTPGKDFQDATTVYLREGKENTQGDVLAMLFSGEVPPPKTGCVALDNDIIAAMAINPASYYVTMNTLQSPTGAGRGQLHYA
ncbi:hypothetical protein CBR_g48755 [Chara braunii]|uniref:CHRD domain-containing protein n=1 Tax=Chara braunii TaxID=69332 RepID=A0A388K4P1_CHABU|nr:hypothetical protein CBR_g48755 [Chara braunii]|eukprot:GBG65007.1 hypothetical protein CBR_g48755 [Chara braunii]